MDFQHIWDKTKTLIQTTIGLSAYTTWFSNISVFYDHQKLILSTPDPFFKDWIADHYLSIIKDCLIQSGGEFITVELSVMDQTTPTSNIIIEEPSLSTRHTTTPNIINNIQKEHTPSRLTFENFVIGSSNQFACAACQAVANAPAKSYNPLFIYGQSGMGKTHLMHAVTNYIKQKQPTLNCLYVTSERFVNELVEALGKRSISTFKQKYRNTDVLLIDDIQFIAGKESTQEEFFHTFNELHSAHKQIIITSDRPANEIIKMEDRLVTRFQWGLTVDIQPPDFETRIAILRKKLTLENVNISIPEDVLYFIAEQIKTNIRQLEGALIRVIAFSLFENKSITLSLAQIVLKDMIGETKKVISLEMIIQKVADHYHLSPEILRSKKKSQNIVNPRQIAMYLTRKLTKHSLPEIGKAFGGRDHTTVMHACAKVEQEMNQNAEIKFSVDKLEQQLNY